MAKRIVLMALVALALSSCSGGASGAGSGGAGSGGAGGDQKENPLVGTWRRVRTCDEYVQQLEQVGMADMIGGHQELVEEFGTGNAAQNSQDSYDPCQGVNGRLPHDHVFYKDGRFASLNQNGKFVDDGHYKFVDDRTIEFGDPPGNLVHFRFSNDGDTVTFDVQMPDMDNCSQPCREETKYRLIVFYPGLPWHRVPPADQWDGEE